MTKPIQDAATLVLGRRAEDGFEVFLSKRTAKAAFMANAYVYPGGRVDAADYDESIPVRLRNDDDRFEDVANPARYRAHVIALLRECFEEAGVLLADRLDGTRLAFDDPAERERFARYRLELNAGGLAFAEILGREGLTLRGDGVDYFAHWITPPFESRRYDTRFFFAEAPAAQEPVPDYSELVHGAWFTPNGALAAYDRGEIQLSPPTLCTLIDLDPLSDLAGAVAWSRAQIPCPIQPKLESIDDTMHLLLPGDPLYPSSHAVEGPTRVVLRDGRFRLEWAPEHDAS